jgi:hypothetical protein
VSTWKYLELEPVIRLIKQRSMLAVKRYDPFLTQLLVAALKVQTQVVCVEWTA